MRIHLTLQKQVRRNPEEKSKALDRILSVAGIRDINKERFDQLGILSGTVDDPSDIERLKGLDEVLDVARDEERFATR